MQIVLVFLAFATILYWLFQLGGANFIQPVSPFFESIKTFTHLFYQRTVSIGGSPMVDFSFLIDAIVMLLITWGLKPVIEYLQFAEKKYDKIYAFLKKKMENSFNTELEKNYIQQENKIDKFIILLNFEVKDLTKDPFYNRNASNDIEEKLKKVSTDFFQSFSEENKCDRRIMPEGMFLYFDNINDVDKTILNLENIIGYIKRKYISEQLQVNFIASIDAYSDKNEILTRIKKLINLNKLNLKDKITCLSTFKHRYSLIEHKKYSIEGQGIYKISEGEEEVFYLKSLR